MTVVEFERRCDIGVTTLSRPEIRQAVDGLATSGGFEFLLACGPVVATCLAAVTTSSLGTKPLETKPLGAT